jgi:cysteinyl-tRNA synthetase
VNDSQPTLQVYNHFRRRKEPFEPLSPERTTMYVCGMTVQGPPHMGHMLAFVAADHVRRCLEHLGYPVYHVQNFTDIDDKIIARAAEMGCEASELAQQNIDLFYAAADALNIRRAHNYPRVTEHIDEIVAYIGRLIEAGHAYASQGNVWFDVRSHARYGELSRRDVDEMRSAGRVDLDDSKRDPLDFALWKAAKEGEPAWESPWGQGRPGWHIECSVMSMKYLGTTFDFHGGGRDLIFPHHENELAQSTALEGDFVRYWMHNGLLTLDGQKMAKSTGHFFSVEEVLGEFDADVVRYYLLRGHFRNQMEYSRERLDEAAAAYDRMKRALLLLEETLADEALGRGVAEGRTSPEGMDLEESAEQAQAGFRAALCDDFNGEAAMAALFELVREAHNYLAGRSRTVCDRGVVAVVLAVLREGLSVMGLFEKVGRTEIPADIAALAQERDAARKSRDFARADALRDELLERGFTVEDTPEGPQLRPA